MSISIMEEKIIITKLHIAILCHFTKVLCSLDINSHAVPTLMISVQLLYAI